MLFLKKPYEKTSIVCFDGKKRKIGMLSDSLDSNQWFSLRGPGDGKMQSLSPPAQIILPVVGDGV